MWSLIFNYETEEYDAVPSSWLIGSTECNYPDKSKRNCVKLAKECNAVEEDWMKVNVRVEQNDFGK